jgi:hypothetical protein
MPSRIQRRRSRGWRQPINAIYVGRPTKWGNPYRVRTGHHTAEEAVTLFRRDLIAGSLPFPIDDIRRELRGKDLVCWCKPGGSMSRRSAACHGQFLIGQEYRDEEIWVYFSVNRLNIFGMPSTAVESLENSSTNCELLASRCS